MGFHGGSVMVELGRPGAMHPLTAESLRAALFTSGPYELRASDEYRDESRDWVDPVTFEAEPPMRPAGEWIWHRPDRVIEGVTWGGNLEILGWLLMADRAVAEPAAYEGAVLVIETSEELPSSLEVYRTLRNMGERGLLGRAKASSFERPNPPAATIKYVEVQRVAVSRAVDEYNPGATVVFDIDLGHTDPQLVIPYGGRIRVDGPARRVTVWY